MIHTQQHVSTAALAAQPPIPGKAGDPRPALAVLEQQP
jgi:hypothetical protein